VTEQPEGWRDQLARYAKAAVTEALLPAAEKLIPQGASEIAQALYAGNAFVPYGPTNQPVPMEAAGMHGPAAEQPASYESSLQQYVTLDPEKQYGRGEEGAALSGQAAAPESNQPATYESELGRYAARTQDHQHTQENQR
jgi:hypothetical protein